MALDQELELLRHLATVRDITELEEYIKHLTDLHRRVQDLAQLQSLGQTLLVGPFAKHLLIALSTSFRSLNRSIAAKQRVNEAYLASVAKLEAVVDVCLRYCTEGHPDTDPVPPDSLLVKLQQDIVHSGLLDSFAATCSTLAAAVTNTNQQHAPSHQYAAISPPQQQQTKTSAAAGHATMDASAAATTASSPITFTQPLLSLWLKFELVEVYASTLGSERYQGAGNRGVTYSHFVTQFLSTIQPVCSYVMALLRHKTSMQINHPADMGPGGSSSSSSGGNRDADWMACLSEVVQLVTNTIYIKVTHIYDTNDDEDHHEDPHPQDPAQVALVEQILQSQHFQQLQLFNLSAITAELHKQQNGESPAELLEPAVAAVDSTSISRRDSAQPKQKLRIADRSAELLQHLGVAEQHAQQYYCSISNPERTLVDCYGVREEINFTVRILQQVVENFSTSQPAATTSSSSSSSNRDDVLLEPRLLLPVLLQLAAQLPILPPLQKILTLIQAISSKLQQTCQISSSQEATAAAVAELGDSILAPLILQVGPAVLHALQQPRVSENARTAAAVKWSEAVQQVAALRVMKMTPGIDYCNLTIHIVAFPAFHYVAVLHEAGMSDFCDVSGGKHALFRNTVTLKLDMYSCHALPQYASSQPSQDNAPAAAAAADLAGADAEQVLNWCDWDYWSDIVKQQPYTAVAAAEVAIRAAAGDRHCSVILLQMTSSLYPSMTTCTRVLLEAGSVTAASNTRSRHIKRLQGFKTDSLAAKPFSMFVTGVKFIEKFARTAADMKELMSAFQCAADALTASQRFRDAAAGTAEEEAYIASRTSAVAAIPWVFAASRVLQCCSQLLLAISETETAAASLEEVTNTASSVGMMYGRLIEPVEWCQELVVLFANPSSYSGTGRSTCSRTAPLGDLVPADMVDKLHQRSLRLQDMLLEGHGKLVNMHLSEYAMDQRPESRPDPDQQRLSTWQDVRTESSKIGQQLQKYAAALSAVVPTTLCCNNPSCSNVSGLSELACVSNSKCSRCKAAGYCSRECQAQHWSQHKKICSKIAAVLR